MWLARPCVAHAGRGGRYWLWADGFGGETRVLRIRSGCGVGKGPTLNGCMVDKGVYHGMGSTRRRLDAVAGRH